MVIVTMNVTMNVTINVMVTMNVMASHQLFPTLEQSKGLPSHLASFTSESSHCL